MTATPDDDLVTVVRVAWTTRLPTAGRVEYGPTAAYGYTTPLVESAEEHSVALLGLTAEAVWHYRVVVDHDGVEVPGDDHTFTTGALPSSLPELSVDRYGPSVWGDYLLFVTADVAEDDAAALILNGDGDVVWYHQTDRGLSMSARFSLDGRAVVMLLEGTEADEPRLVRLPLDGGPAVETIVPRAHHDFQEVDPERYVVITNEVREIDGESVLGDVLVEVSADGIREIWNAFDSLPVEENDGWGQDPADWTHANGLDWDPEADRFLLSLYRLQQVLAIGADTGEVEWTLGLGGDFTFVDDGGFGPQHAPERVPGGILLFDNAERRDQSRVVEYALDEDAHTASLVYSFDEIRGERAYLQGDARRLPDGATISAWGNLGSIVTVNAEGDVARRISVADGLLGKVRKTESLYPPTP